LKFRSYGYQLFQHVTAQDKNVRYTFHCDFLSRLEAELSTVKIVFSDENAFHLPGNVNQHNLTIWGSNSRQEANKHTRDNPKLNVFGASSERHLGTSLFAEHC
jgi:hypothetical protein